MCNKTRIRNLVLTYYAAVHLALTYFERQLRFDICIS